ncbi:FliO/MopB family protein [Alicyclobacillus fastidiosus]|uniref:Flagellar biosynthetic protein FliO n=1 Tax=Alicyclobacillus fastidiosus TaxID=392011 RepID=A0ABV5AGT8_9BACL|nr:flagellar biosynthetic protein FliO [Alicyclobacillus fastidiosus]WEH12086.1 flagellar biosynthetic protein FliO [Alicyclobacillus fastidiosus]
MSIDVTPTVRAVTNSTATSTSFATGTTAAHAIINLVIALVVVVLLIVLLVRFLAKRANVQQRGAIQVIAARQLAPNRSVQVVEVGDKRYLIGVGEDVRMLAEVTDSYESLSPDVDKASFGQALGSALAELRRNQHRDG